MRRSLLQGLMALWLSLMGFGHLHAEEITVEVKGEGISRQDAIVSALASAIEQVSGVKIESASALRVELQSVTTNNTSTDMLAEQQQKEVSKQSGGFVKRYQVINEANDKPSSFSVTLNVVVERFSAPGLPTQDRRRIVVVQPIDLTGKAGANATQIRERLTSYLVQSRRFAVLDRYNGDVFRRELEVLRSPDVPVQETLRIGQVLGTDYLVLIKIRQFDTQRQSETIKLTGKTVETVKSRVALEFSLFEMATRQVKWTGRFIEPQETDLQQALETAASALGEAILNAIYPLLVLQTLPDGTLVINQGGETLKVGQQLAAFRLGEEMTDPYTKEPLGRAETPVGAVIIERVDPKLSYGRSNGAPAQNWQGDVVLRKVQAQPSAPAQNVQPAAQGNKPKW